MELFGEPFPPTRVSQYWKGQWIKTNGGVPILEEGQCIKTNGQCLLQSRMDDFALIRDNLLGNVCSLMLS